MSAQPYSSGRSSLRHPPEEPHGASRSLGQPSQSGSIAAAAGDGQHEVGPRRLQRRRGPDRRVETLARHQSADADDQLGVDGQSESTTGLSSLVVGQRPEPLGVDAGRNDGDRQRAAGGVLGLGCRIAAGGDDVAGPAQHVAESLLGSPAADRAR